MPNHTNLPNADRMREGVVHLAPPNMSRSEDRSYTTIMPPVGAWNRVAIWRSLLQHNDAPTL